MDEDFLVRGAAAQYASPVFHSDYNDFDIYIEDTADGYRKIFSNLLGRVLALDNIALDRVFPLGGRKNVIASARAALQQGGEGRGRKSVFIVDGDLYLLSGESEEISENVLVLPRYCIENFLLDFDAFIELMDEECSEKSRETIAQEAGLIEWQERSRPLLKDLFFIFAANHYLGAGIKTVSRGYRCICKNGLGEVDADKVKKMVEEIHDELIRAKGSEEVMRALSILTERIDGDVCFLNTYVSAKDYSLPLLICRFRAITKSKASDINIKLRLSRKVSVDALQNLASNLKNVTGWVPGGAIG